MIFEAQYFQAFLTPANAMLSVELGFLAEIMDVVGHGSSEISSSARTWSNRVKDALWETTVSVLFEIPVMS